MHAAGGAYMLEHPEDLGGTIKGGQPASIWQLPEVGDLGRRTKAIRVALHQCQFGGISAKPSAFLGTLIGLRSLGHVGWPSFTRVGRRFMEPHSHNCGHKHAPILGKTPEGVWRSQAAAAYPAQLCKAIAEAVWNAVPVLTGSAGDNVQSNQVPEDENLETRKDAEQLLETCSKELEQILGKHAPAPAETSELLGGRGLRGRGPQMAWQGKPFEDGCGICSPGRWPPHRRNMDDEGYSKVVRDELLRALAKHQDIKRTAFQLMAPSFTESPFSEAAVKEGKRAWLRAMQIRGANMTEITGEKHSPIAVMALAEHLKLAQDPDYSFFHCAEHSLTTCLPIGVDEPFPRCPGLFEEKVKHRAYQEQAEEAGHKRNYVSARGNKEAVRQQFLEEEKLGTMCRSTRVEAE